MTAPLEVTVGVVMLVHTAFDRAEQVIRHWARAGSPVVVHLDATVRRRARDAFAERLRDLPKVRFAPRHRCEWGTWGIVAATQDACEILLRDFPEATHAFLTSGACLPLRPIRELCGYLAARPCTDFIESATTAEVPWTVGGLSEERFTLRFPFSFRQQRRLFDAHVRLQRKLGLRRRIPEGIIPHMGSQWWCLTRETLGAILSDPNRAAYDRYFRRVWIPDESYFQTLARRHASWIESRSLTVTRFDTQGKPHVFYDDHLQLLRRSDCFVARKIWPGAERLYATFLTEDRPAPTAEPNPGRIDRVFAKAAERRRRGRPGLWMQGRFPSEGSGRSETAAPYSVFEGFTELFEDWEPWLAHATGARVHGHLFAQERVEWEGRAATSAGAMSDGAALRDHDPRMFLRNLLWNTRGEGRQCFQFGPHDRQFLSWDIAKDPNAQVSVITGAWILPLFRDPGSVPDLRAEAAWRQKVEAEHLRALRSPWARARIRIWSLAEFLEAPMEALQTVLDEMETGRRTAPRLHLGEAPRMVDLAGFGRFLQDLKNGGMHPYLMGDFPADASEDARPRTRVRPYLVG